MTGQPTEKNESQDEQRRDPPGARTWDERTAALAARLEALLEQHRVQRGDGAAEPAADPPPGPPRKPR